MNQLCDDETLQALVQSLQGGAPGVEAIEALLARFPEDPRLHFMRGSALASAKRPIEAHQALSHAVTLAPDFAIARFQLGFFQLTSGEPENALETWGRLDRLPDGHYLRHFVDGLRRLIRDDFPGAIAALREGIRVNQENTPLSGDMQLIIDQCLPLIGEAAGDDVSETSVILGQFLGRRNDVN